MNPALSVILFTTLSGTGYGLWLWLGLRIALGPRAFDFANAVLGSWFGLLVLFCFTWALIHHLLGGIRHFIWDFGFGFDKPARDNLAWANLIGSVVLTIILWIVWLVAR